MSSPGPPAARAPALRTGTTTIFHHMVQDVKIFCNVTQISKQIPRALRSPTYFLSWTLQVWNNGHGLHFRLSLVLTITGFGTTVMCHLMAFWPTVDCVYDGGTPSSQVCSGLQHLSLCKCPCDVQRKTNSPKDTFLRMYVSHCNVACDCITLICSTFLVTLCPSPDV